MIVVDGFSSKAKALRKHFEQRFAEPREAAADRFVWDYWHVPGQYTLLRTPAYHYFPTALYDAFHQQLVAWGRETLGCHDVSPPWLSCYVDGCRQELHGDLPHGQFAFVFSLTPWQTRRFVGGETLLVKDEVLDYWSGFVSNRGLEEGDIFDTVEPEFNRLLVFDPRTPHGVRRVEGTHDPREGRLVIHGWFVQPRPFISGSLSVKELQHAIDQLGEAVGEAVGDAQVAGLLSFRFRVEPSGVVRQLKLLADTLRAPAVDAEKLDVLRGAIARALTTMRFRKQRAASTITLPMVFERQA